MLLSYVIAKVFETFDEEVYTFMLSGHTIKHFFAALAPLLFLVRVYKKDPSR
jgi:hypothetical protein